MVGPLDVAVAFGGTCGESYTSEKKRITMSKVDPDEIALPRSSFASGVLHGRLIVQVQLTYGGNHLRENRLSMQRNPPPSF